MHRTTALALAAVLGSAMLGAPALAQEEHPPRAEDQALATALFKEGRRLMEGGDVPGACRKFEESQRLDPGGGTLLNLAACHEREGRTASAWTEFSLALAQARNDGRQDRVQVAQERVASLEPRLRRLTITVNAAADRPDLDVLLDGVRVGRPAWGIAVPVDPGEHAIEARAPGFIAWKSTVSVEQDGQAKSVEVPALDPAPIPPPPPPTAPVAPSSPPPPPPARPWYTKPWVRDGATIGLAAAGVASVAVGSYLGVHAMSLESTAKGGCPAGRCSDGAASLSQSATTDADWSTGTLAAGGVALAAAGLLWFTRPGDAATTVGAVVTPQGGSFVVRGGF